LGLQKKSLAVRQDALKKTEKKLFFCQYLYLADNTVLDITFYLIKYITHDVVCQGKNNQKILELKK